MKKFSINDEVYLAGFGIKGAIFVWKINRLDGLTTYICSAIKGTNEKEYTAKELFPLGDLF